jgi:uncharacterized protein involved in exopolysaccharide biosynthesis
MNGHTSDEPDSGQSHAALTEAYAPHPGNYAPEAHDEISLWELFVVLTKHKLLIIGLPAVVGILAVAYVLTLPDVFTATAKILPPQQNELTGMAAMISQLGSAAGVPELSAGKNANDLYVAMLKSRTVADNILKRFDLMKLYGVTRASRARVRLSGSANISSGRDGIISIDFDDTDPIRAAAIANAYVDELTKLTQLLAVTEASQRRLFFEKQLAQAKVSLERAEAAARKALAQRGLVKVEEQGRAMAETIARLRGQITVKEVQIGAMRAFAASENADLRLAQRELDAMKQELARMEGTAGARPGAKGTAAPGMQSVGLLRDVKFHEVVYELLSKQYELAKIDEAKDAAIIQVLDEAIPPDVKSKPKRLLTVLGAVTVAGILAVLLAFIREVLGRHRARAARGDRFNRASAF